MGAELRRLREGLHTKTGMNEKQLEEFASKPIRKDEPSEEDKKIGITDVCPKCGKKYSGGGWGRPSFCPNCGYEFKKSIDGLIKAIESEDEGLISKSISDVKESISKGKPFFTSYGKAGGGTIGRLASYQPKEKKPKEDKIDKKFAQRFIEDFRREHGLEKEDDSKIAWEYLSPIQRAQLKTLRPDVKDVAAKIEEENKSKPIKKDILPKPKLSKPIAAMSPEEKQAWNKAMKDYHNSAYVENTKPDAFRDINCKLKNLKSKIYSQNPEHAGDYYAKEPVADEISHIKKSIDNFLEKQGFQTGYITKPIMVNRGGKVFIENRRTRPGGLESRGQQQPMLEETSIASEPNISCPRCGSTKLDINPDNDQELICKKCGKTFNPEEEK